MRPIADQIAVWNSNSGRGFPPPILAASTHGLKFPYSKGRKARYLYSCNLYCIVYLSRSVATKRRHLILCRNSTPPQKSLKFVLKKATLFKGWKAFHSHTTGKYCTGKGFFFGCLFFDVLVSSSPSFSAIEMEDFSGQNMMLIYRTHRIYLHMWLVCL